MTTSRSIRVAAGLALVLAASPLYAKTTLLSEALNDLRKALPPQAAATPGAQVAAYAARNLDQVETLVNQNRLPEAEQVLSQVKPVMPLDNEKASAAYDAALAAVRAKAAELAAKQDAAYAALEQDFVTKFNARAPAAAYDALLQQIAAHSAPGDGGYNNLNAQKLELLRNFVARWQDYLLQSATGNGQQAYQTINELMQQASRTTFVPRSQLATIVSDAAAKSRNDLGDAQLDGLRKKLAALIDTAKSPADFDALLAEVPRPNNNYNNSGQAEMLRRAIIRWQDYFAQTEAGNTQGAQNLLREATNDATLESYYPRSKVLARLYPQNPGFVVPAVSAPPVPANGSKPEPLPPLSLETLDKYAQNLPRVILEAGSGAEDLPTEINSLRSMQSLLKVGNYQAVLINARSLTNSFPNSMGRFGPHAAVLMQIRQDLVVRALAEVSKVPPELKPDGGESLENFIRRAVDYGREKKDWSLISRIFTNAQNTSSLSTGLTQEAMAYRSFFSGMQQETAELWTQAVRTYLTCLSIGLTNLPVDEISQRLKRIKAGHPVEYTTGTTPSQMIYSPAAAPAVGTRIDPGVPGRP